MVEQHARNGGADKLYRAEKLIIVNEKYYKSLKEEMFSCLSFAPKKDPFNPLEPARIPKLEDAHSIEYRGVPIIQRDVPDGFFIDSP